ncbi:MAG: pyridoxine 5'-phosphate synthase [Nitrospinae bacterium]|nr:pyridoxine 5'-phosphate synthase [Nitrospinota bacterium]
MPLLGVNVDHIATVRQARRATYPDPLDGAKAAVAAGACQITVHLREDRRHIQDHDVLRIKKSVASRLNLEMAVAEEIVLFALKVRPWQVTLVPERRQEVTTEGGLDLIKGRRRLREVIPRFRAKKILVSLFIDPDPAQVAVAKTLGADAVEFNTGAYAEARTKRGASVELAKLKRGVAQAVGLGLTCHAGHGLTLSNVGPVAAIPGIGELNIGHALVSRALMVGFGEAVREMRQAIGDGAR